MAWHWRKSKACDLDELLEDINPQMKDLEGALIAKRPAIMAGYPDAVGAIVANTEVSHTGSVTETTLKSTDFGRGALSSKGGFRITAAGTCTGTLGAKDIIIKWGGATVFTLNVAGANDRDWSIVIHFWNINSTQDQRYLVWAYDATTLETMDLGIVQVDTM